MYKSKTIKKWQNIINKKVFTESLYDSKNLINEVEKISNKIKKHRKIIGRLLGYTRSTKYDNDFRSGEETYGYESIEIIYWNLFYISDRCHCSFRLAWLKEVPERFQILNNTY